VHRQAVEEAGELGPEPADAANPDLWRKERWVRSFCSAGAGDDPAVLHRAADEVADKTAKAWLDPAPLAGLDGISSLPRRDLLADAIECAEDERGG